MGWFKKNKEFLELKKAIWEHKKIGPKKVMISPTDSCNLRCKICWRLDKEEDPNTRKDEELSFKEIIKILEDCKKLGVKVIDLTGGGEAFCRKDIFRIIKYAKNQGFFVTLTTNGTLLNQAKIKKLIDMKLDDICFSLESYDEKINDYIREDGVFKNVIRTIEILNKIKNENYSEKPIIRIGTVITKFNYKNLDGFIDFCIKNNIKGINFSVLIEWESNKNFSMKNEKYQEVFERLNKVLKKQGISSNLDPILKEGLFEHEPPKSCFSPWEMVFINSQGDILACCTLASLYENVLGNVRKERFIQIWYGKNMEKFRDKIKRGDFFKGCSKCLPEITEKYNKLYNKIKKF